MSVISPEARIKMAAAQIAASEKRRGFADGQVLEMIDAGRIMADITARFQCDSNVIWKIAGRHSRKMTLPKPEWTSAKIQELTTRWNAGESSAAIGRAMGMTKNKVVGKAHRLGLAGRESPIKAGTAKVKGAHPIERIVPLPKLASVAPVLFGTVALVKDGGSVVVGMPIALPILASALPDVLPALPTFKPVSARRCEWLDGDKPRNFVRCGESCAGSSSWCAGHSSRVFVRRAVQAA